jgi:hypothetical protein
MNYEQHAEQFAQKHDIKLKINRSEYKKHFADDTQPRQVFNCALSRNGKKYTFNFGQSRHAGCTPPTMYDILSCLTKHDPESFEDFCACYGYDNDSIKALKVYKACVKEFNAVEKLMGDILEELQEIQ